MEDKNYYMDAPIGNSGIAQVNNPAFLRDNYNAFKLTPRKINVGEHFDTDSSIDEYIGNVNDITDLGRTVDDVRAEKQSGLDMIGNAIANNLVIAGTTAVSGTLGLVDTLLEGTWDNTVNNAMADIQDSAREAMPIYRGQEYEDKTIWDKLGTGIFWAELVQNLGFTEGMLLPGMGAASLLRGAPTWLARIGGSLTSAIGEASTEAINAKNDEITNKRAIAYQKYNELASEVSDHETLAMLNQEYARTLEDIDNDAIHAGNFVFGANIALLALTNNIEFGNLFTRGMGTAKRLKGALKRKDGVYSAGNTSWEMTKNVGKGLVNAFTEGMEEVSQSAITNTPSNYTDYNTFNESMLNPDKRELVGNLLSALGKSYAETLHDSKTAEEFASGFLIGAIGVPTLRKSKIPIKLENNMFLDLREDYRNLRAAQRQAEEINARLKDSKGIKSYYNGLVRHLTLQDRMNTALDKEDTFEYKNAESAQFISDVRMFDEAGDIEYLREIVNNSIDTSDEGIKQLIDATSKDGEGPFMQNGNRMTNDEVRQILEEKKQILNAKIDSYLESKSIIETTYPNADKETVNNAVFLKEQAKDHINRYKSLIEETHPKINQIIESVDNNDSVEKSQKSKRIPKGKGIYVYIDGKKTLVRKEDIDYYDENGRPVFKSKEESRGSNSFSREEFEKSVGNGLFDAIINGYLDVAEKDSNISATVDDIKRLRASMQDIVKLKKNLGNIKRSLSEILSDMSKSKKDLNATENKVIQQDKEKKSKDFRQALSNAQNMQQFREAVSNSEDPATIESILQEMENGGSQLAKNYREVEQYNREVKRKINESVASEQEKQDALKLLQDQYNYSESLEQIANPNSVFVTNENAFDEEANSTEEALDRFRKAQYILQDAMGKVNEDTRFKDRFSAPHTTPEAEVLDSTVVRSDDRGDTGDSGTSTIPAVNAGSPVNTYQPPVGNIQSDAVLAENKETNGAIDTPQSFDSRQGNTRKYYRPAIPELHIEASKDGDFRPFNVVASEREDANFDAIYNYLVDNGAFDYINNGNLHEGDEIGFMIDPTFEEKVKDEPWHTQPTIFLVTKDGQIVGSLDESPSSVSRYEGLAGLQEKVRKEYLRAEDKTKRFTATPKTKVSRMMTGKVAYDNNERNLASIPGVMNSGSTPIFGIIKNGTMSTNGMVSDDKIIKPVNMAGKEGRMYLLIPNGAGKYSPAAVRVKHFNNQEFNLDDVTVASTPMGKDLLSAISKMADSMSEEDLTNAVKDLNKVLYTGNLHIDYFTSKEGNGIRITQVERDANGDEIYDETPTGRKRRETSRPIFLTEKWDNATMYVIGEDNNVQTSPNQKSAAQVEKEIKDALMSFNLPLQVSISELGKAGYVNRVLNSGILTSNIQSAKVVGNWFTMDYFDAEGNLQSAVSPASVRPESGRKVETPVGGRESVVSGTPVQVGNSTVYVDLKQMVITQDGKSRGITSDDSLLVDLAWAQDNFGNATNSAIMKDNKVITPSGRVLDRNTHQYLSSEEAQRVKDAIAGRNADREARLQEAEKVVSQIRENQKSVDRDKTDSDYYYVLEEDGKYHQYDRVHKRLGSNWIESKKQTEALTQVRTNLSKYVDDPKQFDNYLQFLENKYKIKLDDYKGKTDARSRDTIVNIVRDRMAGTNSQRALDAGTAVDSIIRQYFTIKDVSKITKPSNMSESAYLDLLERLRVVKENIENSGERFITDNVILYVKYPDGTRIAGEVDILALDRDGNFKIYDVKTSRYSFHEFEDRNHRKVNYFKNPSPTQRMSTEAYYTLQLSAYKNLFESQYHLPVTQLGIMPFVLGYEKDMVTSITGEKGIPITYNPAVAVPLIGNTAAPVAPTDGQVFKSGAKIDEQSPVGVSEASVAKFDRDGEIVSAPIKKVATIGGVDVFIHKEPVITKGFGRPGEEEHIAFYNYWAVFPNGKSVKVVPNVSPSVGDEVPTQKLVEALSAKPEKVQALASEVTKIGPDTAPKQETASTILSSEQSGAASTLQAEQAINPVTKRTRRHLRAVDGNRPVWNQEKELKWLEKVLPQLSKEQRVSVVKGLINVAEKGPVAWGQFEDGMVTLSSEAAQGTAYHEAFHVVFNTLLDQSEIDALYAEAKAKFGDMTNDELEEHMANDFMEYTLSQDKRGLGRKMLDFFKSLFDKITNWRYVKPSLTNYYRMINQGKYANSDFKVSPLNIQKNTSSWSSISQENREILSKKGWTEKQFNNISQEERDQALRCISF